MKKNLIALGVILTLFKTGAFAQQQPVPAPLKIAQVSLLVKDYDEAVQFYTGKLGFSKTADNQFGKQRWVTIAPPSQKEMSLVLVKALTPADTNLIGRQAGSRTLLVLETDHFDQLYQRYQEKGVTFMTKPSATGWGRQVQFTDLYGNHLVLLEVKPDNTTH